MSFNKEWLVSWDELAPSLQELFKTLQTQITNNRTEINNLDDRVTQNEKDIEDAKKEIEAIIDGDKDIYIEGEQGQVLKVNQREKKIYPHDEFLKLRCVSSDKELAEEMKSIPISIKNVFDEWYRYAHYSREGCYYLEGAYNRDTPVYPEGQNLNYPEYTRFTSKNANGWTYNELDQSIYINGDSYPVAGFINTEDEYTNYYLRIRLHNRGDGDNGGIVIGYVRDSAGVEHTLSILRGASACSYQWGLVYDAGNPGYVDLHNGSNDIGRGNGMCYLIVTRSDKYFEFKTTQWAGNIPFDKSLVVKEATFTFEFPETKPASWSQSMYDNIKAMLDHPNRLGFVVRSGDLGFKIDYQHNVFDDEDIYALHTDKVYTYDFVNGKWAIKGNLHDLLSNKIFIYYPRMKYFYFYNYWGTWTKLELDPNKDIIEQIQNQIKTINNNVTNLTNKVNNNYNELKTYVNNTVNNSQTVVNNYADEKDFLNLAPKIGYYGEDTVKVIPKYNMNTMEYGYAITTESNGQEVMYFCASDGGPVGGTKWQLYKAYRTGDNVAFTFDNEPILPQYLKNTAGDTRVVSVRSCDNKWLCCNVLVNGQSKWHLINTKFTSDQSFWTTYKDITSIVNYGGTWRSIKYIEEYGTIVAFYITSYNNTIKYGLKMRVFRYSNLALLKEIDLENPLYFVHCTTNLSFCDTEQILDLCNSKSWPQDWNGWSNAGFMYYHEQELLVFMVAGMSVYYYTWPGLAQKSTRTPMKLAWKVPISIAKGSSGIVTCLNDHTDYIVGANWHNYLYNGLDNHSAHKEISYDSFLKKTYINCKYRDNSTDINSFKYNDKDQSMIGVADPKPLGLLKAVTINSNLIVPPDASLWGKQIYRYVFLFDYLFIATRNKDGNHCVWVKQWRYVKGSEAGHCIEPVPGQYKEISGTNFFGNINAASVIMPNGTARYIRGNYEPANNRLIYNELTYVIEDDTLKFVDSTVDTQTFTYDSSMIDPQNNYTKEIKNVFYNPIGKYWLLLIQDRGSDKNINACRKLFFMIVKEDGTVIPFGEKFINKHSSYLTSINNQAYNLFPARDQSTRSCSPIIQSATRWYVPIYWNESLGGYSNAPVRIDFNSSLTDFTMTNMPGPPWDSYGFRWNIENMHYTYCTKLGVCHYGNSWNYYPMAFHTQNKFLTDGTNHTVDQFLENPSTNSNGYYMYLQSAQGLVAYVPQIPIFLGGYFSVIKNPISVVLSPNCDNYIYLERDSNDRTAILAYASKDKFMEEGVRQFNRILIARIKTNEESPIDIQYYRINTGYNDYSFH